MIESEKANYKIAWLCRMLEVPRSSFYDYKTPAAALSAYQVAAAA